MVELISVTTPGYPYMASIGQIAENFNVSIYREYLLITVCYISGVTFPVFRADKRQIAAWANSANKKPETPKLVFRLENNSFQSGQTEKHYRDIIKMDRF
jgi:hypothetical protein